MIGWHNIYRVTTKYEITECTKLNKKETELYRMKISVLSVPTCVPTEFYKKAFFNLCFFSFAETLFEAYKLS